MNFSKDSNYLVQKPINSMRYPAAVTYNRIVS